MDAAYLCAGALTGFLIGLTGVGGGALMTPLLLLVFGVAPVTAVATDLWFAAITKGVAASVHRRHAEVDWPVVRRLWLGSLPVTLAVVAVMSMGAQTEKAAWLSQAIGLMVCLAALGMLLGPWWLQRQAAARSAAKARAPRWQTALTVLAGAFIGGAVALTSVGAGTLGTVLLLALYPMRLSAQRLVMTDLVHAIPLALAAGLGYAGSGLVDWRLLGLLLLGSLPFAVIGSLLAGRLKPRRLQLALAAVLLLAGSKAMMA
jgi:uncharacterized membrane protein YfcA